MKSAVDPSVTPKRRVGAAKKLPLLPVAPSPRIPRGKVGRAIVAFLRQDPNRTFDAKQVAVGTKLPGSTVRKELVRLLLPGLKGSPPPVERVGAGLYACRLTEADRARLENPPPKVHALQLAWKGACSLVTTGQNDGLADGRARVRARGTLRDAAFGQVHAQGSWVREEHSRSYRAARWFGLMRCTLQAYPTTGTILASVEASRDPLGPTDLQALRGYLAGVFQVEGFNWTEPRVATVEINRDFERFRLKGVEAARFFLGEVGLRGTRLSLDALQGALVQIYNKEKLGVMRLEVRLNPRDLDLRGLQDLVVNMLYGPSSQAPDDVPPPTDPGGAYA